MNGLRTVCHCGHDQDSHFFDPAQKRRRACLCRGCDCSTYTHEDAPKPPPPPKPVRRRTYDDEVETLPMMPVAPPTGPDPFGTDPLDPHSKDCPCLDCVADRTFGPSFPLGWP